MDKQKQVEGITDIIMTIQTIYHEKASSEQIAQELVNANCRIVGQDSVVLTQEEYHKLKMLEKYHITCEDVNEYITNARNQAVKEVIKKLIEELYRIVKDNYMALQTHIAKHNISIADNDFCQRCKGKAEALSDIYNYIDELAKTLAKKPDFTNHTGDPDWN